MANLQEAAERLTTEAFRYNTSGHIDHAKTIYLKAAGVREISYGEEPKGTLARYILGVQSMDFYSKAGADNHVVRLGSHILTEMSILELEAGSFAPNWLASGELRNEILSMVDTATQALEASQG